MQQTDQDSATAHTGKQPREDGAGPGDSNIQTNPESHFQAPSLLSNCLPATYQEGLNCC